jgi:hypothetical protein
MGQSMLRIMPVIMAFICLRLPGALVLYMFVSNLYRVGQQQLISHTIYKPAHASGLFDSVIEAKANDAKSTDPVPSKGFLQNLLGDAAPRIGKNADHGFKADGVNGNGNGTKGSSNGNGTKGTTRKAPSPKSSSPAKSSPPAKAPNPRPTGGRATPTGSRPAGANRKKKRR